VLLFYVIVFYISVVYVCIAGKQSLALLVFPSHQIIILPVSLIEYCCKHCQMHECLDGNCRTQPGRVCVQVDHPNPSPPPSQDRCMVRMAPFPLILQILLAYFTMACLWHYSSVPWITVAQTCGWLIGSHLPSPSTTISPFLIFPWERVSWLLF
jgi:hypothetical protein